MLQVCVSVVCVWVCLRAGMCRSVYTCAFCEGLRVYVEVYVCRGICVCIGECMYLYLCSKCVWVCNVLPFYTQHSCPQTSSGFQRHPAVPYQKIPSLDRSLPCQACWMRTLPLARTMANQVSPRLQSAASNRHSVSAELSYLHDCVGVQVFKNALCVFRMNSLRFSTM